MQFPIISKENIDVCAVKEELNGIS